MVVEGGASVLRMGRRSWRCSTVAPLMAPPCAPFLYRQQLLRRLLPASAALAALSETDLDTLFGYFGVSQVSAGAEVVRAGAPGNVITIIASGQARRGKGDEAVVLKAGDVIGEAELLRRSDFTETVESVTSMISFTLTWEALTLVMEDIPGGLERVRQRLEDREAGRWPPPPPPPGDEVEELGEAELLDVVEDLEDLDEAGDDGFDERVIEEILQDRSKRPS
ncbi:MAG: cyclic nucleotide-binding domain-containing protein [bacterium]